jgi:hypothetical protein
MKKKLFVLFLAACSVVAISTLGEQAPSIPTSLPDPASYHLLEEQRNGEIVTALHKNESKYGTLYVRTETDCTTMLMRHLGESEEAPEKIVERPSKWFELVTGSTKYDVGHFVCKRLRENVQPVSR